MKVTIWAALGSLFINLLLGMTVAALFSVAPAAAAAEPAHCSPPQAHHGVVSPAQPAASQRNYLVAVRMGWAA